MHFRMEFSDILIKKYDLTDLERLDDEEILILWIEITTGFETLNLEDNPKYNALKPVNFTSWNNLVTELKDRNLLENQKIPKIISSQEINQNDTKMGKCSLKIRTGLTKRFQCKFCVVRMNLISKLIVHINNVHFGHRFRCVNCNKLFKSQCGKHTKSCQPGKVVKLVKAIFPNKKSGEMFAAELQDAKNCRFKENMIKIKKVEMNTKIFEIINVEQFAIEHSLLKCCFCEQLSKTKKDWQRHFERVHKNVHL